MFFDLYDEDTEGARPDRLFEVRPQRDQRRTVEHIVDTTLIVPSLDVPVPQMENQLIPEQAIEVRKISSPSRHCRRRVRFAEQTTLILAWLEAFKIFAHFKGSAASSSVSPGHAGEGFFFFSHVPLPKKKCEDKSALGVGIECGHQLIRAERSSNGSKQFGIALDTG